MTLFSYSSTRADVNPLPSPWETLGPSGLRVVSNRIIGNSANPSISGYMASVTNFSDDQYAELIYSGTIAAGDHVGCGVRGQNSGSGFTGYTVHPNGGDSRVYLQKWVNGVASTVTSPIVTLASPIRIEARTVAGNAELSVFAGGVEITGSPFTDSTSPITGGQPVSYYDFDNTNANTITNISGGDISSAPTISAGTLSMMGVGI